MKLTKVKTALVTATGVVGALGVTAQLAFAVNFTGIGAVPILQNQDLLTLVSNIINYVLIFTGVIAVVYLIYGGLMYITAGGDAEKASKGRVAITNAIIGIIIIMASYAIYTAVVDAGTKGSTGVTEEGTVL